jgi:Mrp family chromosome partitioning ATPase
MDVDICGPSISLLMGLSQSTIHTSLPAGRPHTLSTTLPSCPIGFLLPSSSDAVIWRSPKKNGLITQFLKDVEWGDLDNMVVDTPPGASDEHLSIVQYLKEAGIDGAVLARPLRKSLCNMYARKSTFAARSASPLSASWRTPCSGSQQPKGIGLYNP